ncbi:HD domain-containing phosphohydrolase [Deltaproteobacteria bacterium TL4]
MPEVKKVTVDQLTENMRILAFVRFAKQYRPLDEQKCKFIQLNFVGATTTVMRNGREVQCLAEKVKIGDHIVRIDQIPSKLQKIVTVTRVLIHELKPRGFHEFEVELLPPKTTTKSAQHLQSVQQTQEFVHQVKQNIVTRAKASEAIKSMMDSARVGKMDTVEIKNYIDNIAETNSAEAIKAIAGLKSSDQTYAHCVDAAAIYQSTYYAIKERRKEPGVFEDPRMALFAGFMHDCGKSKIPQDILDSTVRFERESREMHLLQSHPVFGAEILTEMQMSKYVVNIAHYHHVKMDSSLNSSYPAGVAFEKVLMETRLASIVDVYQALIGRRSYKKSWPPAATIRFIDALSGVEFDPVVWEDFLWVMGRYPVGTLVRLNEGSLAFVVSVPVHDLERPKVVIVRSPDGTEVQNNSLIDLQEEQTIRIDKDLDHYDVYGDRALEVFSSINVS